MSDATAEGHFVVTVFVGELFDSVDGQHRFTSWQATMDFVRARIEAGQMTMVAHGDFAVPQHRRHEALKSVLTKVVEKVQAEQ